MRKLVISLVILLVVAAGVFYLGWVQFVVPVGAYGIMVSKTSGIHPHLITSGQFLWRWERLLPTNSQLRIFSLAPVSLTDTFSSTLPSAQLYSSKLDGSPDFSYTITISSEARVRRERLISLVESHDLEGQEALDAFVTAQLHQFNRDCVAYILEQAEDDTTGLRAQTISTRELVEGVQAGQKFPDLEILSTKLSDIKVPDIGLYNTARDAYINSMIGGTGSQQIADSGQLSALVQLGEILTKYPALSEYLATGDASTTLQLLSTSERPQEGNQ